MPLVDSGWASAGVLRAFRAEAVAVPTCAEAPAAPPARTATSAMSSPSAPTGSRRRAAGVGFRIATRFITRIELRLDCTDTSRREKFLSGLVVRSSGWTLPSEGLGLAHRFARRDGAPRAIVSGLVTAETENPSPLRPLADDLRERRERLRLGGGAERIEAQHAAGKLTARERIALLLDEGTFTELGMDGREAPADGVITGWGTVDGRLCAVAAYDFTVMAGSMGMTGELKVTRLRELALSQ